MTRCPCDCSILFGSRVKRPKAGAAPASNFPCGLSGASEWGSASLVLRADALVAAVALGTCLDGWVAWVGAMVREASEPGHRETSLRAFAEELPKRPSRIPRLRPFCFVSDPYFHILWNCCHSEAPFVVGVAFFMRPFSQSQNILANKPTWVPCQCMPATSLCHAGTQKVLILVHLFDGSDHHARPHLDYMI